MLRREGIELPKIWFLAPTAMCHAQHTHTYIHASHTRNIYMHGTTPQSAPVMDEPLPTEF